MARGKKAEAPVLFTEKPEVDQIFESDKEIDLPDDFGEAMIVQATIPGTLDSIASQNERAIKLLEARVGLVEHLRGLSVITTDEHDWVLYKRTEDTGLQVITGYLQDQGCRRIGAYWGVCSGETGEPVKEPVRVTLEGLGGCRNEEHQKDLGQHAEGASCIDWVEARSFYYVVTGSATSRLTGETTETLEGMASSDDDFLRRNKMTALRADMWARAASRTRWDGKAVRALSGLGNIIIANIYPNEEEWRLSTLASLWTARGKDWKRCPTGRGFTKSKGKGGYGERASPPPGAERPRCPICKFPTNFQKLPEGEFWVCAKAGAKTDKCEGKVPV